VSGAGPAVYLHVGSPKSGTTYLQSVLRNNRELLGRAGVLVAGERHADLVHAGLVVREDPRLENLGQRARTSWSRIVEEVRAWPGHTAIISYELFAGASVEQVRRSLADLDGLDVHVVVTARDLALALPSAWQERLKFAVRTPLEDWKPRGEKGGPRVEWGWRTLDPALVTARWGADLPPDHVHIVTVPRRGAPPDTLWTRFAEACALGVEGLDLSVTTANQSLSPAPAELLRRVNGTIEAPIVGNREQARWLRDTLAHQVLVPLGGDRMGMTDEQFEQAAERSERAIAALRERGYTIHGDLEDIRATRPEGRTPGQVSDDELLDTAVHAINGLLLLLREARTEGGDDVAGRTPRARARGVIEGAASSYAGRRTDALEKRIAELEESVQRGRALHRRVAELDDVVAELLLPVADQDDQALRKAITTYRRDSL